MTEYTYTHPFFISQTHSDVHIPTEIIFFYISCCAATCGQNFVAIYRLCCFCLFDQNAQVSNYSFRLGEKALK